MGSGSDVLIAGFVLAGSGSKTLLIRAIGPTLGAFGVPDPLADPKLELHAGGALLQANDDWGGSAELTAAFGRGGAFPLAVRASKDAALLVTLSPGAYTVQVRGPAGTTGIALVELYELP